MTRVLFVLLTVLLSFSSKIIKDKTRLSDFGPFSDGSVTVMYILGGVCAVRYSGICFLPRVNI